MPYTRGSEFSRSINEIVKETKDLTNNGAKEITFLGQNVNAYNFNGFKISNLINEISKIKSLKRIRYTTSHPIDFSQDLIDTHSQSEKINAFDSPSGSKWLKQDSKAMNRKHKIESYIQLIEKLKKANPLIKLSSDFIIGYPGETDEDFKMTLRLIEEIKYVNTYSFIFSPRPGTPEED